MHRMFPLLIILMSCGDKDVVETDTEGDADTDADADADTDADADVDDCTTLVDGSWGFNGDNFNGQARADLIWDGSCTFTLQNWTPAQGNYPDGGIVDYDQVTLDGAQAMWATCTGTAEAAGDRVAGNCTQNSTTFGMQLMP